MVHATRIYETVLYAADLDAAAKFYTEGFGLKLLSQNELMLVLGIEQNYLLIFDPGKTNASGRAVPTHGSQGQGHVAFVAAESELPAWRERLGRADIEIETEVQWQGELSGTSIYVRDPAGNSVELAPPTLWSYLDD